MKKVNAGPIGLVCTTIAGARPILRASWRAPPSARARSPSVCAGTGSVNDTCTMPSPVVSPYGRMIRFGSGEMSLPGPGSKALAASLTLLPLKDVGCRVVVAVGVGDDPVEALAAVGRPPGDAEGALRDRRE